jgi:hypothetical protein
LQRADQIEFAEGKVSRDYFLPIVADAGEMVGPALASAGGNAWPPWHPTAQLGGSPASCVDSRPVLDCPMLLPGRCRSAVRWLLPPQHLFVSCCSGLLFRCWTSLPFRC